MIDVDAGDLIALALQRIGADRSHTRVNVRLITATNRDLPKEIASGNFREDLFFRLNVIRMHIPPLRERIEDVPILFEHYLGAYCEQHRVERPQIAPGTWDALMAYRWPGNIRELRNVAERIALKSTGPVLRPTDLPAEFARRAERALVALGKAEALREAPRQYLNRLSDLLFVLARVLNRMHGGDDVYWKSERLAQGQ